MTHMACPFCAASGNVRLDRRGRPYWSCMGCQSRIFMHTDLGFLGFCLSSGLTAGLGKQRWDQEVEKARGLVEMPVSLASSAVKVARTAAPVHAAAEGENSKEVKDERPTAPFDRK